MQSADNRSWADCWEQDHLRIQSSITVGHANRERATEVVNRFRSQRNLQPYPGDWLPENCLVVTDTATGKEVAVCSLNVFMGSFHGVIDDLHTDLDAPDDVKALAIDAIVSSCELAAKELGLRYLDFYTSAPPVMKHALRHGFEFINEQYTRFIKRV